MFKKINIASAKAPLPLPQDAEMQRITMLPLTSRLTREQVLGTFWRKLPPRSLLPNAMMLLRATEPEIKNRLHGLIGTRGKGKTTLANVIGQMRGQPIFSVDCGAMKDLNQLIFTTELDEQSKPTLEAINERLKSPEVKEADKTLALQELGEIVDPDTQQIDAANLEHIDPKSIDQINQRIEKVQSLLGLTSNKQSLGIRISPGPLVEAFKKGGMLVLNEINRGENTNALHEVFSFIAGDSDMQELTLQRGNCQIKLNRRDMGQFTCIMTGNERKEELGVKLMAASLMDRAGGNIRKIESELDPRDLAQVIATQLTGLPLPTIEETYGQMPPTEYLEWMLSRGLNQTEQQYTIKPHWIENLNRANEINQAAMQLGGFYAEAGKMIQDEELNGQGFDMEQEQKNMTTIGNRLAANQIYQALYTWDFKVHQEEFVPDFSREALENEEPIVGRQGQYNPKAGTRLANIIVEDIGTWNTTDQLKEALLITAYKYGIIHKNQLAPRTAAKLTPEDAPENENRVYIDELLNSKKVAKIAERHIAIQKAIHENARLLDPENTPDNPNELISLQEVATSEQAYNEVIKATIEEDLKQNGHFEHIVTINPDYFTEGPEKASLFQVLEYRTADWIPEPPTHQLVNTGLILEALREPYLSQIIFNQEHRAIVDENEPIDRKNPLVGLRTKTDGKETTLIIFRLDNGTKTLVVSDTNLKQYPSTAKLIKDWEDLEIGPPEKDQEKTRDSEKIFFTHKPELFAKKGMNKEERTTAHTELLSFIQGVLEIPPVDKLTRLLMNLDTGGRQKGQVALTERAKEINERIRSEMTEGLTR